VHLLPSRVILRNNGSYSNDRQLLSRIVFTFVLVGVLELSRRILPSDCSLFKLYGVPRRLILRYNGPDCSDRSLCSGIILGFIFYLVLKLFFGSVFIVDLFDKLLELSCRLVSGINRINRLQRMPRGVVLRDNWSHSCDKLLRFWIIFSGICNGVF